MRYFGTGETFLFKFQKGSILTKYEWVKKDLSDDEEDESPKKKERGKEVEGKGADVFSTRKNFQGKTRFAGCTGKQRGQLPFFHWD